jgi:membrane-bound ClpP family serine protease
MLIFLQSLYIALHAPGHGAAEAVAVVSLGLLVGIPLLTGYAQWWEVAVIFVGLALCAFEIFVFPGHMVSLIVGTVMVLFGLILTFSGKEPTGIPGWLPSLQTTWHGIQNGILAVVSALFGSFLLSMWLRRYLPSIPYFSKLILTATSGGSASPTARPPPDLWPFVGTVGVTATDLRPGGSVEFPFGDATRASAVVSLSGYLPKGTKVVVEQIDGSSVRVRPLKSDS